MPQSVLRPLFALALSALAAQATAQSYYMVAPLRSATVAKAPAPAPEVTLSLAPGELPDAMLGKDYSQDLTRFLSVTGDSGQMPDPVDWTLASGTLPVGLSLSSKGVVAGKPTALNQAGATFEVLASYKDKSGRQTYTIKVGEAVLQVVQITAGDSHSCAVTTAGAVKCWGYNRYGQLGDGTTTNRFTPVQVSGLESGVSSIEAENAVTCAITTAGAAKCWGLNSSGQLGDGTTTNRFTPVQVSGLESGVSSISPGSTHSCAVTTAGSVKCWGYNYYGQLGNGSSSDALTPVQVSGLTTGVGGTAAGYLSTCAVTTEGGVKCWGLNSSGQLGDGTTTNRFTPVQVSGLESGVRSIAVNWHHACAISTAGAVKCWGYNYHGQLGNGSTTNRSTPVQVSGLTTGVAGVSMGEVHTCAVTTAGAVKCWGSNFVGQVGDGTTSDRLTPVAVQGLGSGVRGIAMGRYSSCVVTTAGTAKCWGYNSYGQLGDGTTTQRVTPVNVQDR